MEKAASELELVCGNLYDQVNRHHPGEDCTTLVETPFIEIKRIVSLNHPSPETGWYNQKETEWVTVLQGAAKLEFKSGEKVEMKPGDHLVIPAQREHRVIWTSPDQETVWLAVHYPSGPEQPNLPPTP